MASRNWTLAVLLAGGLTGSACALILGAEDLPEGSGGSGSTGTATSTATGYTAATSGSHAASSSASSTGGQMCVQLGDCTSCTTCMENGPCNLADAGCTDSACIDYTECMIQCVLDGGPTACMAACNSVEPPQYPTVDACLCTQCKGVCPQMCN